MEHKPPRWADRFLSWYCNPDLLEEIQGDAHELYNYRLKKHGRWRANVHYWWDVIRFLRASNVKREPNDFRPGLFGVLWQLNFRIAMRNASRNRFTFVVKVLGLAVCLAFTLTLSAFVIQEFGYDRFHPGYDRLYRVGSYVVLDNTHTHYAVSPLQLGPALYDELPQVEGYTRMMYLEKPVFRINDNLFSHTQALAADSSFLKTFGYKLISGTTEALHEPNSVVVTESLGRLLFGDEDPYGRNVDFHGLVLAVTGVLEDVPVNSHLQFDALISWNSFTRNDSWDNINAYTYVRLREGVALGQATADIATVVNDYLEERISEYDARFTPIVQPVTDIHLWRYLDEDIAVKRKASNLYVLIVVIVLFGATGLINYHNLALAELTTQQKKIGILRVFGGVNASAQKIAFTDAVICLLLVLPLGAVLMYAGLELSFALFGARIDASVLGGTWFILFAASFLILMLLSTRLNTWVALGTPLAALQQKSAAIKQGSIPVRKYLVSTQLAFSVIVMGLIVVVIDQLQYINQADKGIEDANTIVLTMPSYNYRKNMLVVEELKTVPGVRDAATSSFFPAGQIETRDVFQVETGDGMKQRMMQYLQVSPSFFSMMKIRLAEGEFFDESSIQSMPFLVNEAAVKDFGWTHAIGKNIMGPGGMDGKVIGVVRDFHLTSLHDPIAPLVIIPPFEDWGAAFLYVKTDPVHPPDLIRQIENAQKKVYTDHPFELNFLDSRYASLYREDFEVQNILEAGLAISVFASCLGIFSISALMMILRTREMGIRKIVGATNRQLFMLHTKVFVRFIVIAVAIALPAIYYLANYWLSTFAYHIGMKSGHFVLPVVAVVVIVLATSAWHARQNAAVNPVDVLKQET